MKVPTAQLLIDILSISRLPIFVYKMLENLVYILKFGGPVFFGRCVCLCRGGGRMQSQTCKYMNFDYFDQILDFFWFWWKFKFASSSFWSGIQNLGPFLNTLRSLPRQGTTGVVRWVRGRTIPNNTILTCWGGILWLKLQKLDDQILNFFRIWWKFTHMYG